MRFSFVFKSSSVRRMCRACECQNLQSQLFCNSNFLIACVRDRMCVSVHTCAYSPTERTHTWEKSLSLSLSFYLPFSLSVCLSLSNSHAHAHAHTRTLSFSLSLVSVSFSLSSLSLSLSLSLSSLSLRPVDGSLKNMQRGSLLGLQLLCLCFRPTQRMLTEKVQVCAKYVNMCACK